MENRKAFEIRNILIFYNFFQAIVNIIIAYEIVSGIIDHWDARCMVKYNPELPKLIQKTLYNFVIDCFPVSCTVFEIGPLISKFVYRWRCFYIAIGFAINTVIHIVMYSYYGLAAFGPKMRKYLWWKKYLTVIQITQIFFVAVYLLIGVLTGCEEMGLVESLAFVYVFLNLVLFLNFYRKYKKE
ncbi:hypothetical protein AVEN_49638-1 [Araneus ventricosus]|uniref:Elongation of very long chain fatty acids protein n=1 Tax=Araneus ventricosus TaxID=182803 RepID=A0A4Y2H5S2_ARAVE|nr:hypothetical protein AVEN_49638-1 [Araneus ventricosus]